MSWGKTKKHETEKVADDPVIAIPPEPARDPHTWSRERIHVKLEAGHRTLNVSFDGGSHWHPLKIEEAQDLAAYVRTALEAVQA